MLANGTTLGYSTTGTTPINYITLPDLKEIPDFFNDKEKVENTGLAASNKEYEFGVGDYGDLEYTFKFKNSATTDTYRVLKAYADSNTVLYFKQTYPDGTAMTFSGQVSVGSTGGGLNKPIDCKVKIALASSVTVTNPSSGGGD
jgi:hypothetical protein